MNIILFLLFAAICKLCRVLLSSPDILPRTQKPEAIADEPLAEEPSPPNESTESETVSQSKKPKFVHIYKYTFTFCAVAGNADSYYIFFKPHNLFALYTKVLFSEMAFAFSVEKIEEILLQSIFLNTTQFTNYKQFLDAVFVISEIIKVEVSVISRSRRLKLITLTETLIISDITKTESNNCFIIHCFKANNDKRIIAPNKVYFRHAMFSLRCP